MASRGMEGTVLGTLFMPYFSGLGNLILVWVILSQNGPAEELAINAWTNNITNLCLLLALPALIWGLHLKPEKKSKSAHRTAQLNKLSLALTLVAMIFFTLMVWTLGQDGEIDQFDGAALVGLFFFWQCFHLYEVLKEKHRGGSQGWGPMILFDLLLILIGSLCTIVSVDGIVFSILKSEAEILGPGQLGIVTGFLMVMPNAVLAFYYAKKKQADVVYSSQIGDGHICIPLCIGIFAIFKPLPIPPIWGTGLLLVASISLIHLVCIVFLRGLPKTVAIALLGIYGYSMYLQLSV